MTRNKKLIFGILAAAVLVVIYQVNYCNKPNQPITTIEPSVSAEPREHWHSMVEKISLWQNGEEQVIDPLQNPKEYIQIGDLLIETLRKLNLQATWAIFGEDIQKIKENDRVIEMTFRFPEDIVISQWIGNRYRILENVNGTLFILEDNLDEGLGAHILVGHEIEGRIGYSCWAIQQEGSNELDKTWIDEINNIFSGAS